MLTEDVDEKTGFADHLETVVKPWRKRKIRFLCNPTAHKLWKSQEVMSYLKQEAGEPLALERGLISGLNVILFLSALAAIFELPRLFGWWALVLVPLMISLFKFIQGLSVFFPASLMGAASVWLIFAGLNVWEHKFSIHSEWFHLFLAIAVWSAVAVQSCTSWFLRSLALRNWKAYQLLIKTDMMKAESR